LNTRRSLAVVALVLLGNGPFCVDALAEPVRLHVRVGKESDGLALGGAYLRLTCPSVQVEITTRTALDGWGLLEFGYEATQVDLPGAGTLQLSPTARPNPVSGEGVVPYVRPAGKSADDADLTLYDLRGYALAHGRLGAGGLELPGSGAPAGIYLLRCVDRASGAHSDCRIVAAGAPLRRLRFVPTEATVARRDPPDSFPAVLTVRYPSYVEREIAVVLVPGDQDLDVALTSVAGNWPAQTWLFASDHGWNSAAVDSGWVPALADTALVFTRRMIDTDGTRHAYAQWDPDHPTREFCDDDILPGRSSSALMYSPPVVPVIYFDFADIPPGATVESAWLIISPLVGSRIPCAPGAAHAATLDIWSADATWLQAPVSGTCGNAQGNEHWRRTSWMYADAANQVRWQPSLSERQSWDEFGLHSKPVTYEVPGGHACRYDVTRALQTWSDNRGVMANAGFVLSNWRPYANFYLAAGPNAIVANLQPLLVVTVSERPRTLPWQGHPLAFSFGTDDGDSANVRYMEICEQHGVRLTAFMMRQGVREFSGNNPQKLSIAQWQDLAARGHEVGHHSDHHPGTWGLAEITWGQVDSMDVELARDTWMESVFQDQGQTAGAADVLAYPSGGVSLWAIKNLVNHDFILGRCAGGTEFWGVPIWGNSGWCTYLSWYDPVNLFNVAITDHSWLVGQKTDDVTLNDIRLRLRRVTADMLNQGQSALLTFCHGTKASPYARGMDYDELDWLLTAVQESGLYWIGTHGELARCYRDAHLPVAPGDGIGHAAYDSLVAAGHQEFTNVWWVLPETAGR
jgi:peptidoglycan/xylan/chitin deacetylase (PgdA/CDA1 family)